MADAENLTALIARSRRNVARTDALIARNHPERDQVTPAPSVGLDPEPPSAGGPSALRPLDDLI